MECDKINNLNIKQLNEYCEKYRFFICYNNKNKKILFIKNGTDKF